MPNCGIEHRPPDEGDGHHRCHIGQQERRPDEGAARELLADRHRRQHAEPDGEHDRAGGVDERRRQAGPQRPGADHPHVVVEGQRLEEVRRADLDQAHALEGKEDRPQQGEDDEGQHDQQGGRHQPQAQARIALGEGSPLGWPVGGDGHDGCSWWETRKENGAERCPGCRWDQRTRDAVWLSERQPPRSVLICSAAFCALAVASAALVPELIISARRLRDHELTGYGPGECALILRQAPPLERVGALGDRLQRLGRVDRRTATPSCRLPFRACSSRRRTAADSPPSPSGSGPCPPARWPASPGSRRSSCR